MFIPGVKLAQKKGGDALKVRVCQIQPEPSGWRSPLCCGQNLLLFYATCLFWFPFQQLPFSAYNLIIFTKTIIIFDPLICFISFISICYLLNYYAQHGKI